MKRRARFTRRQLLEAGMAFGAAGPWTIARSQPGPDGALDDLVEFRRLVAANRVLANEGVVDAFGHASVRHPLFPDRYVMSRSRSPALVEFSDLMEFDRQSGDPLDPRGRRTYGERMIHGAVYEARPEINAVVHHHAYDVLPFSVTSTPLRPVIHTASVIGADVPVWDIAENFGATDMLVRTMEMGRDLALTLGRNRCLLMRGHGAVVTGESLQEAVITAIYLQVNARVLLQAQSVGEPRGLSEEEIALSRGAQLSPLAMERAWEYLCLRAGVDPV